MDNKTKLINEQLRTSVFNTVKSEDCAKKEDGKGYRWLANSGEMMPGFFGGIQLDIESMHLERFKLNPVILFSHDSNKPIGIGHPSKEDSKLFMDVFFDEVDEASKNIRAKVDAGTLRGMSVGMSFDKCTDDDFVWDKEAENVTIFNSELLESSICSIPRDMNALKQSQYSITAKTGTEELDKEIIDASTTHEPDKGRNDMEDKPIETNDVEKEDVAKEKAEKVTEEVVEDADESTATNPTECVECLKNALLVAELRGDLKTSRAETDKIQIEFEGLSESLVFTEDTGKPDHSDKTGIDKVKAVFEAQSEAKNK